MFALGGGGERDGGIIGAAHTKVDLKLDRSEIDLSSLRESVHTHLDRSWIDLSSHLSVHIQLDRFGISRSI